MLKKTALFLRDGFPNKDGECAKALLIITNQMQSPSMEEIDEVNRSIAFISI